jgi:hypothetical protein
LPPINLMPTYFLPLKPNAGGEPRPMAEAT